MKYIRALGKNNFALRKGVWEEIRRVLSIRELFGIQRYQRYSVYEVESDRIERSSSEFRTIYFKVSGMREK